MFYCVKLCVAGRSKGNIEVRRLDLKRTCFTANEHNTGDHFYVEASFRLKDCLEKSENLTSERERKMMVRTEVENILEGKKSKQ